MTFIYRSLKYNLIASGKKKQLISYIHIIIKILLKWGKYRPFSQIHNDIVMVLVLFHMYILIPMTWIVVGEGIYIVPYILFNNHTILSHKHKQFGFILIRVQISVHSLSSFNDNGEILIEFHVSCVSCSLSNLCNYNVHWFFYTLCKMIYLKVDFARHTCR